MGRIALISFIVVHLLIPGCAGFSSRTGTETLFCTETSSRGSIRIRTEMYFGRCKTEECASDDERVSDADWNTFVDGHLATRFDGFTIMDADGAWKSAEGIIVREKTKILIIVHGNDQGSYDAIEAVRREYRELFSQESVLVVSTCAEVSF